MKLWKSTVQFPTIDLSEMMAYMVQSCFVEIMFEYRAEVENGR